jgi:hypothetical protein
MEGEGLPLVQVLVLSTVIFILDDNVDLYCILFFLGRRKDDFLAEGTAVMMRCDVVPYCCCNSCSPLNRCGCGCGCDCRDHPVDDMEEKAKKEEEEDMGDRSSSFRRNAPIIGIRIRSWMTKAACLFCNMYFTGDAVRPTRPNGVEVDRMESRVLRLLL